MITMATVEPTNRPIRILNNGGEHFRSTSSSTQGSDSRRMSAAERLEADKLKYVKSAKARQRKAAAESPLTSFAEAPHSMATASPVSIDDDDVEKNDVTSNGGKGRDLKTTHPKLNKPTKEGDVREGLKQLNSERFKQKCGPDIGLKMATPKKKGCQSPKGERSKKPLSTYLNKTEEGFTAVTSSMTRDDIGPDGNQARQSRSVATKTSKFRSSSVGAKQVRATRSAPQKQPTLTSPPDVAMLSPRTKLKQARQNLKKVESSNPERSRNFPPSHNRPKTFSVVPRLNDENRDKVLADNKVKLRSTGKSPRSQGRPFSVIENKVTQNMFEPLRKEGGTAKLDSNRDFVRRRVSPGQDEVTPRGKPEPASGSASDRLMSSQRLKRRSWDLAHSMDNSFQIALMKPPAPQLSQPALDAVQGTPLSSLPQAQPRKAWIRPAPSCGDARKIVNRISSNEDRPGAKMNITVALEEILNPLEDDDMDTAYSSMSPDASMDCKTLVAPSSSEEKSNSFITPNVSATSRLVKKGEAPPRPKSPDSSRSKTPTADDGFGTNDVSVTSRESPERWKDSQQSSPESVVRHRTPAGKQRHWSTTNDVTTTSQPLNRIDLAPDRGANGGIPNSPMLAPRSRREVAPDYSRNVNSGSLSRSTSCDDQITTMKSQTTSSSASGDMSKPLTALTASDLKPRRGKKGAAVHHPTPLKPTCPYPSNSHRGSPKRHNNTPVSPTLSPNKQAARMTPSHGSRSSSSTPYSSLKRTPTSSRNSSLKRNRQRSKSDVSIFQSELDRFFSTMGMDELFSPLPAARDTLFTTANVCSESDFSFAGASAYVRDGLDESMEVDPATAGLASAPSVSIIEKNARVMRWLMACKKTLPPPSPRTQSYKPQSPQRFPSYPPPVPPRVSSYQALVTCLPKESGV